MQQGFRYIAIGRYADGVNVLGYILRDTVTGQASLLPRVEVEKIALMKDIANISAQIYNGKVIMKGVGCKLSELPNYDKHCNVVEKKERTGVSNDKVMITGRLLDGKATVGYVLCLRSNGVTCSEKKASREQVLKLARDGYIANARVQMNNGKPVLRGVNCELSKLPSARC